MASEHMRRLGLVCLLILGIAATGCGSDRTYKTDEVKEAFRMQGYTLVRWRIPHRGQPQENVLVPQESQRFTVFVGTDSEAAAAWSDYESQYDDDSFDAPRANVVLISDGGLTQADRRAVVSALGALPNRGAPVLTIEAPTGDREND